MKKTILTLTLALAALSTPAFAQDNAQQAATAEEVVAVVGVETEGEGEAVETAVLPVVTTNGDETVIEYNGTTFTISTEEYEAEKARGLSDLKIAKNQRINAADSAGVGVTLMAMCIVLCALIVLSILFMFFGKVFARKQSQKKKEAHGVDAETPHDDDDHDSGEVIAAIAMALDEHFNSKHDLEDTVLTIRRMKRAYSPWNSKIYNMRELPARSRH